MLKRLLLVAALCFLWHGAFAQSAPCSPVPNVLPFTLTNGTIADANQVMGNFTGINNCLNGVFVSHTSNANITTPITTTGSVIAGLTSASVSADTILSYTFCTSSACLPLPSAGGGNYDGVRGVGISNLSTTTPIVAGVSGYVLANQAFVGAGPSSVALFGTGAVNVDGGFVEGVNTNVSDHQYRTPSGAAATPRRINGAEFDVSASYTNTVVQGILVAGNSVVQPANSTAIAIVGQDFSAAHPGSIAKWTQDIFSFDGTSNLFALVGSYCQSFSGSQTCDAQAMEFGAYVSGGAGQGVLQFGPGTGGGFACITCNHATFQFQMNWGLNINTGGLLARSTTDQIIQLGGVLDLPSGATVESRNDANNALTPMELVAQYVYVNGPLLLKTSTVGTLTSCVPAIANSFAAVSDATAPTYNGTLTGGGAVHVPVFCDGTTWRSH